MSLDVYLTVPYAVSQPANDGIYIREGGSTRAITREEWDDRHPDREPVTVTQDPDAVTNQVYSANITHNLNVMAEAAGLYGVLWRPEESGIATAHELIPSLRIGLQCLQQDPDWFRTMNPENGWGTYEGLVSFVEQYLEACLEYPEATVSVWR